MKTSRDPSPAQLSDTFLQALPDLTLVVQRDGTIVSNLGGRELGIFAKPGSLLGKSLAEVCNKEVAAAMHKHILRSIRTGGETRHLYEYDSQRFEVRLRPQGSDRVLMVLRRVPPDRAERSSEAVGVAPPQAAKEVSGNAFLQHLADAVASARLRESRLGVAVIRFDAGDKAEGIDVSLGERLLAASIERVISIGEAPLCASLEGGQLAVLLEDIPGHDAAGRIAEQVRKALAAELVIEGRHFTRSPCIGVALYPGDGREAQGLLDIASACALEARSSGRGSCVAFCSDTVPVRALSRLDLEQELRSALDRRQFEVLYLPILELSGRRMEAIEAVLRWAHPVCGLVPPEQFRPLLETLELQGKVDRWVLGHACRDLAELTRRGNTRQRVSVKLSRQFLGDESMLSHVDAALSSADITPSRLVIDVDLRSLAGAGRTREQLRQLRKRGARVFLDEFGTEGVPLARLAHLPVDGVKIARSFVARLEHDSGARAVCSSIVAIAHVFGLRCVAPGIETRAQLDFLLGLQCDEAHGPLFGGPQRVGEFAAEAP